MPRIPRPFAQCLLTAALAIATAGSSCSKQSDAGGERRELPPLHFSSETPNLMLTWIDARGDTHVEASLDKVPKEGRSFVRVLISDSQDGTKDPIYVADLSEPEADGGFTARGVPRATWEDEITRRRKDADPEVALAAPVRDQKPARPRSAPNGPAPLNAPPAPQDSSSPSTPLNPAFASVTAIVYGAEWCGPCHEALAHLKKKGVKAIFKDIDRDRTAQAEMKQKLEKIGGRRGAIPVIDIGGQIIVGYSAGALDAALQRALGGTAL